MGVIEIDAQDTADLLSARPSLNDLSSILSMAPRKIAIRGIGVRT